ncbi:MAG: biopolymer transporter ExbD [Acidobacteriota bacterium]
MNNSYNNNKYIVEINVLAMIGVIFVLISAFMVLSPNGCGGISIVLPKSINSEEDKNIAKEKAMIIAIPENGVYYIDKDQVNKNQIPKKIKEISEERKRIYRIVYIKGGNQVSYGSIVDTISALRKAGIYRIGLVTEKQAIE